MWLLKTPRPDEHSLLEDAQGILTGTILVALSIQFLRASDLITGQIAGLSLLLSLPTGISFGVLFFCLNLPFYLLGLRQLGMRFTLKTLSAVTLMSFLAETIPLAVTINAIHPGLSAVLFGILSGVGLLILFRHGATLGGVGIVALWAQDRFGIKAGHIQLGFDAMLFAVAFWMLPPAMVAWSLLGAVVLNIIITVNHRRDRYIAR